MVLADREPTSIPGASAINCHVDRIFDPSRNGSNERSGDAPGKQRIREAGRCTLKEKANALGCL
jgi:hypothetical protein